MAVQEFLDLARIDVFAATDDHVFRAADDAAKAVLVDDGQVARVHPARRIDGFVCFFRVAPVALHHGITARKQFALLAARHDAPFRIDDFHFQVRVDAANRGHAHFARVFDRCLEADGRRFRHAIRDGNFRHVHQFDDPRHDFHRAGRAGHDAGAQVRQIVLLEVRMIEDGDEHGRHAM